KNGGTEERAIISRVFWSNPRRYRFGTFVSRAGVKECAVRASVQISSATFTNRIAQYFTHARDRFPPACRSDSCTSFSAVAHSEKLDPVVSRGFRSIFARRLFTTRFHVAALLVFSIHTHPCDVIAWTLNCLAVRPQMLYRTLPVCHLGHPLSPLEGGELTFPSGT